MRTHSREQRGHLINQKIAQENRRAELNKPKRADKGWVCSESSGRALKEGRAKEPCDGHRVQPQARRSLPEPGSSLSRRPPDSPGDLQSHPGTLQPQRTLQTHSGDLQSHLGTSRLTQGTPQPGVETAVSMYGVSSVPSQASPEPRGRGGLPFEDEEASTREGSHGRAGVGVILGVTCPGLDFACTVRAQPQRQA